MRKKLKKARQNHSLTQKQVAEILGILPTSYQKIEYGERTGSVKIWDKLEDLFSISQKELRENEGGNKD